MKSPVFQRLLGALILICLSAILWPIIFDDFHSESELDRRTRIPDAPRFESIAVPSPAIKVPTPAYNPKPQENSAAEVSAQELSSTPKLDQQNIPIAWVIRLGTFASEDNANKLKKDLQVNEFDVYVRAVNGDKGRLYQVFVGPYQIEKEAFKVKQSLYESKKLKGIIVRYRP